MDDELNLVNEFLALDTYDKNKHYDLILLLGNAVAQTGLMAYDLYQKGQATYFMIAGGRGHTTDILEKTLQTKYEVKIGQSDAELFKMAIEKQFGRDDSILMEKKSTNSGENITLAFAELKKHNIEVKNVLLVHDPLMQRRVDATARLQQPVVSFDNYRCFLPHVKDLRLTNQIWGLWSQERYLALVLGEMKRVLDDENGYGPKGAGYLAHVDVPAKVLAAYQHLLAKYHNYQRQ